MIHLTSMGSDNPIVSAEGRHQCMEETCGWKFSVTKADTWKRNGSRCQKCGSRRVRRLEEGETKGNGFDPLKARRTGIKWKVGPHTCLDCKFNLSITREEAATQKVACPRCKGINLQEVEQDGEIKARTGRRGGRPLIDMATIQAALAEAMAQQLGGTK